MANVDKNRKICEQVEVIYEYAIDYKNDDIDGRCEINNYVYKVKKAKYERKQAYTNPINDGECIERYKIAYSALINKEENPKYNFVDIKIINKNFDKFSIINNIKKNDIEDFIYLSNCITYALIENSMFANELGKKIKTKINDSALFKSIIDRMKSNTKSEWIMIYVLFLIRNCDLQNKKELANSLKNEFVLSTKKYNRIMNEKIDELES